MISCGYRNGSSILPLQVKDTLFSAMVLLHHIYKLRHWLDSSFPLDILFFFLQLHFGIWSRGFNVTFLLCPIMIFGILLIQLFLTLTALRLKILWSLRLLGKYFVTNWRNVFATFVETDLLKGGLNHIMFKWLQLESKPQPVVVT